MSPQVMYFDLKWQKQEFSQTQHCHSMIQTICPQFLTKFTTNLKCGFEENVQIPNIFTKNCQKLQKLTIFGQNLENENSFKNLLGTLF